MVTTVADNPALIIDDIIYRSIDDRDGTVTERAAVMSQYWSFLPVVTVVQQGKTAIWHQQDSSITFQAAGAGPGKRALQEGM